MSTLRFATKGRLSIPWATTTTAGSTRTALVTTTGSRRSEPTTTTTTTTMLRLATCSRKYFTTTTFVTTTDRGMDMLSSPGVSNLYLTQGLATSTNHYYNHHQQQVQAVDGGIIRRWKHSAKMGKHLERLDEMAHDTSRKEAQEKRQKKKDKKAARKGKKSHDDQDATTSTGGSGKAKPSLMDSMMAGAADDFDDDHVEEDDHDDDQTILPDPDSVKERMMNFVTRFNESLKGIRGAEPTPELFDEVMVQAYGASTPLKSVAQVVITSATQASATCFDPAVAKDVSHALVEKMGLNPSVEEGGVVRIPIPRVSMESRQKTAAQLNKRTESYRQKIRNVRRKVLDIVKKGVAGKLEGISKDDAFRVQKDIEQVTEEAIQKLNEMSEKKHESIMAV